MKIRIIAGVLCLMAVLGVHKNVHLPQPSFDQTAQHLANAVLPATPAAQAPEWNRPGHLSRVLILNP
ncbi:MAG: hypothetical protein KDC12_12820 [Flavobacteriales bacterium]|nr:hypothetical protein [Flavobacteriales bacterium]